MFITRINEIIVIKKSINNRVFEQSFITVITFGTLPFDTNVNDKRRKVKGRQLYTKRQYEHFVFQNVCVLLSTKERVGSKLVGQWKFKINQKSKFK